ncbi:MAG: amino acid ABC transporter permease [Firmicutes bacterium]|nr:amino acid ABC transporter permease [Bacillota bacterium]MBQ1525279.1 amino acid ABC transporter permease [Bacillota bacterium]MBQ1887339.1 amino acid ABC transporter permease [Bacillota bacterium]MBQ2455838.1 amino acid ABC transporter permease [Bacillota bacterium]MBQ4233406.1 amino acid ABC transporter permease [Bacillota bacterium]
MGLGPGILDVLRDYYPIFLRGMVGTLEYAFIAVFFGSILGALIALINLSKSKILNTIGTVYVNVLRGTPLLVQMYIAYFFIPIAIPALNSVSKVVYVLLALILNSSAYVSEIIRGGINSVDKGQTEAARSLGMTASHTMTKIVLPQAIKNILPALANEYIAMIKETSLAGTFMLYELMYTRTLLANKFLIWQPLFIIAAIYLMLTLVLSAGVRFMEKRLSVSD